MKSLSHRINLRLGFLLASLATISSAQVIESENTKAAERSIVRSVENCIFTSEIGDADKKPCRYGLVKLSNQEPSHSSLVQHFNFLAELGHRLYLNSNLRLAISHSSEGTYKYSGSVVKVSEGRIKNRLGDVLLAQNTDGYKFIGTDSTGKICETPDNSDPVYSVCYYYETYIFEKRLDKQEKGVKQIVIEGTGGPGSRPSLEMEAAIRSKIDEGYYATMALSRFEVLMEKGDGFDRNTEVKVVRSTGSTDDLFKLINNAAKSGFRLGPINKGIAVLYRDPKTLRTGVLYSVLDSRKKAFLRDFEKIRNSNARYVTAYGEKKSDSRYLLVFEKNLDRTPSTFDYKLVDLEFNLPRDKVSKSPEFSISDGLASVEKTINTELRQGFEIRDLIGLSGLKVLLERRR